MTNSNPLKTLGLESKIPRSNDLRALFIHSAVSERRSHAGGAAGAAKPPIHIAEEVALFLIADPSVANSAK
jgi:hypothetical protein